MKTQFGLGVSYYFQSEMETKIAAFFGEMPDHQAEYSFATNKLKLFDVSNALKKLDSNVKIMSKVETAFKTEYTKASDGSDYGGIPYEDESSNSITFFSDKKVAFIEYHQRNGIGPVSLFYYDDSDQVFLKKASAVIKKFGNDIVDASKNKKLVYMLIQKGTRVGLEEIDVDDLRVPEKKSTHYNDDFIKFSDHLEKVLSKRNKSGLAILHGEPGAGKTTYIRYLLGAIKNKKLIYIPPSMAASVAHPDMMSIFLEHQNSVLIIEDAEEVLRTRESETGNNQAVSNILNITDGIMSDALKMQIVCTFNTDIANIDPALRRPGRLIGEYKFGSLELTKAKELIGHLYGANYWDEHKELAKKYAKGMTLANIYSLEEPEFLIGEKVHTFGFTQ